MGRSRLGSKTLNIKTKTHTHARVRRSPYAGRYFAQGGRHSLSTSCSARTELPFALLLLVAQFLDGTDIAPHYFSGHLRSSTVASGPGRGVSFTPLATTCRWGLWWLLLLVVAVVVVLIASTPQHFPLLVLFPCWSRCNAACPRLTIDARAAVGGRVDEIVILILLPVTVFARVRRHVRAIGGQLYTRGRQQKKNEVVA